MPGQEGFVVVAKAFKGFELATEVEASLAVMAYVERNDAYGVAGDQVFVTFLIVEGKGKDAVQFFEEVNALVSIEPRMTSQSDPVWKA